MWGEWRVNSEEWGSYHYDKVLDNVYKRSYIISAITRRARLGILWLQ